MEYYRLNSLLLDEKLTHTKTMESFAAIPSGDCLVGAHPHPMSPTLYVDEEDEVLPSGYGAKVENLQLQVNANIAFLS